MAFIKEDVLEKNKEKYDSFGLKYDGKNREVNKGTQWHIDKERDIYWIYLGGGALERPYTYVLIWNNTRVVIDAEIRGTKTEEHWIIKKIKSSQELKIYKNELIEIIKEAVQSMYCVKTVIFKAIPDITFVSEDMLNG